MQQNGVNTQIENSYTPTEPSVEDDEQELFGSCISDSCEDY